MRAVGVGQTVGCAGGLAVRLTTSHVDVATAVRSSHIVKCLGQGWQMFHVGLLRRGMYKVALSVAALSVRSADAHHAVRHVDAHTVGQLLGQLSHFLPLAVGVIRIFQRIDIGIEFLFSTFGCGHFREVATSGHPKGMVEIAGKRG